MSASSTPPTVLTADVTIIGGGPSGSTAATLLTRAGLNVVLIDKATFPRDKCCGDGLTTAALRRLEKIGLDPTTLPSWRVVTDTTWRSPSSHTIDLAVPADEGVRIAVARRTELDAALLNIARDSGARVYEGHGFESIERFDNRVRVRANGLPPIESDYVIGADGMWSPLRRAVAPSNTPYLGEIHAFRQYFKNVTGTGKDKLWVSFEPDLLPGYVWSFPVSDGCANVGFGIARRPGQSIQWMKEVWPDILQRPHVREVLGEHAEPEAPHKAWPIPASIETRRLHAWNGRVLFVGDAARVVDPLTGEGIGQAMETAEMVAHAIISAGATQPMQAAKSYVNEIRFGMAIDNRFARSLARLVTHERPARAAIRFAPLGPWKGRYAVKWAFEDNPRAALLTPWRWPQRFANKGGAYK